MVASSVVRSGMSLTFCATARTGLGHIRRVANIAAAVRRAAPELRLRIVANAPLAALSTSERALFDEVHLADRGVMARCPPVLQATAVVVDTAVIPDIELLPVPLALVLRETPAQRLSAFSLPGGRAWDQLILASPEQEWRLPPGVIGAREVHHVGHIFRVPDRGSPVLERRAGERILLVANGGGGSDDGGVIAAEIDAVIATVRAGSSHPIRVLQVRGPRTPASGILSEANELVDVSSRLDEAFGEAHAVISTAGYNSVLELALTSTPALLWTAGRTYDDQGARARAWGERLGLAHRRGAIAESAGWLAGVLSDRRRRAPVPLPPSGSQAAARALVSLAQGAHAERKPVIFAKPRPKGVLCALDQVASRSQALFERGVATMPARHRDERLELAWIDGATLFEEWQRLPAGTSRYGLVRKAVAPLVTLHGVARTGLRLANLDPWRKVDTRLGSSVLQDILGTERMSILASVAACLGRGVASSRGAADRSVVVHGDYHLRNLMKPTGASGYILVDHDDLAWGERESDIGNCIANIVTNPTLWRGTIVPGVIQLGEAFKTAYAAECGIPLSADVIIQYAAIALLRRALKLAERDRDVKFADAMIVCAAALARRLEPALLSPARAGEMQAASRKRGWR